MGGVTHLITIAVAPIFLLTAVAATLSVFISRLTRVVDRGRLLEKEPQSSAELKVLERRAHLIYRAMTLGVIAAICICLLMVMLFAGALAGFDATAPVAALFLLALIAYTLALVLLLREVFLALGSFELGLKLHKR
jgi:hypothetical protein